MHISCISYHISVTFFDKSSSFLANLEQVKPCAVEYLPIEMCDEGKTLVYFETKVNCINKQR
jgi:hypothetical protein